MAGRQVAVLTSIGQLFHSGPVAGLAGGQLLERFAARRDEAAFAALVALHGPMVLGVCRRILRDGHDVEDAFQATFLVLVKRAGSIRDPGRLGPWLHGVARRVARRARAESLRRRSQQDPSGPPAVAEQPAVRPISRAEGDDVLDIIDEEVARLPSRYREAVVLCDLEGRSYAEAARRLSCPMGTLQSRLARGRARLRTRLVRRGVAPTALAAILAESARATVPDAMAEATIRAATAGAVSATAAAAALAGPVARSLVVSTMKKIAGVLCLASITLGAGLLAHDRPGAGPMDPATAAAAVVEPPRSEPPKTNRTLKLEVVGGAEGSALPGASVWARANWSPLHDSQGTTDEEGRYTVALPAGTTTSLQVIVVHPGFAPIELRWAGAEPIPDSYTVALERGVSIGGMVRDEQGRPIAGARVLLQVGAAPRGGRERYPNSEIAAAVTDDPGRWRSEALPASAGPGARLELVTTHPDHVVLKQPVTADALRAFAPNAVLKAGRSVSGTVTSPTGRPVAGATVVVLNRHGAGELQRLRTDAGGRFRTGRFIDPSWDELRLSVQADGFASAMWRLANTPEVPSQAVRLSPRRPMRGRVVDAQGRPVPGASVLPSRESFNGDLDWEGETDADGRFVWFEAPASGTILLDVVKPSFRTILARPVAGGSGEVVLTLHRPQHLHGTATDAETGRPIGRFTLTPGDGPHLPGWAVDWKGRQARTFTDGRFDLPGDLSADRGEPRSIRIEADGYEPAESLGFPGDAEDVVRDVKLRKDARRKVALSGIVRGPDGRPVAGAEVALGDDRSGIRIEDGHLAGQDVSASHRTRTDREGRYAFPSSAGDPWIAVVHDSGFAMRSPEQLVASSAITLAPWGRIEGVLRFGRDPAPGQAIKAAFINGPFPGFVDAEVQTDREGRFVLERVPPGRLLVCRAVRHHESGYTPSHRIAVDVAPGQTARIQIGGTGRPVVGRLALPSGAAMNHFLSGPARLHSEPPPMPIPPESPRLTDEQWTAWRNALIRTPQWEDYFEGEHQYAVAFRPDGAFRIEDVPAGRYILELPFRGNAGGNQPPRRALAKADVVVPEMAGGRSDEPLDIGVIPLDVFALRELNVGDRIPAIEASDSDGRPLDLAALRGKYVLLAFWATSHVATRASIPHLNATHDAFGRDPRLVMIGLNQDISPELMRRYAAHRGIAWEQRHISGWGDTNPIAAAFGVRYPGGVFLIGPDGRIIARDLQGDAIQQAVARALGQDR